MTRIFSVFLLASACVGPTEPGGGATSTSDSPLLVGDPFLSGDPARMAGLFSMVWEVPDEPAAEWWVAGNTFWPGTFGWTGDVLVPSAGLESCQVRDGDPEYAFDEASVGAVDLYAGAVQVALEHPSTSWYSAHTELAALDPRGLSWQFVGAGDDLSAFDVPDAIVFPTGTLVVTGPFGAASASTALPFTWTGDAAERVEIRLSDGWIDVRCPVVDDGSFDIDASLLARMEPGTISYRVTRLNLAGILIGPTDWIEVRAEQAAYGTLTLGP